MNTETLDSVPGAAIASFVHDGEPSVAHLDNILVPLDFSGMTSSLLRYAVSLARPSGAKLTLLHVLKPPLVASDFPYPGAGGQDGLGVINRSLSKIRSLLVPRDLRAEVIVRQSSVCDGILDVAREIHADLIVVSTRGNTGIKHLLLGSTAESIVRLASCPVLVVR